MKAFPKKTKFNFRHRNIMTSVRTKVAHATGYIFSSNMVKASQSGAITYNQLDAARKLLLKRLGKTTKVWFRVFTDCPYTKKPLETRMGKGKAAVSTWIAPIRAGTVILELTNTIDVSPAICKSIENKIGVKCFLEKKTY